MSQTSVEWASRPIKRTRILHRSAPYKPQKPLPLIFYYDSDTTGPNLFEDHITAIGVTVEEKHVNPPYCISKLIGMSREIQPTVLQVNTKLTNDGKGVFPKALSSICVWIKMKCKEARAKTGTFYYPVLAAHNGLKFHFAILVSEMKRHGMDRYHFDDIRFTDTLQILRTHLRHEDTSYNLPYLGLEFLYNHFGTELYKVENSALVDALKLKNIFSNAMLRELPSRYLRYHLHAFDFLEERYEKIRSERLKERWRKTEKQAKQKDHVRTNVFILYCKDTELQRSHGITAEEFCQDVLELADILTWCGGIKCSMDAFEMEHKSNWNQWTLKKIQEATHVIMVCSPQLMKHFSFDGENDVMMHKGMFHSRAVVNLIQAPKFIPVFLNNCVPSDLKLWVPAQLHTSRQYRLLNMRALHEQVDPEGSTSEERTARLAQCLQEPCNQELVDLVRQLRSEHDVIPPESPACPIPLPLASSQDEKMEYKREILMSLGMNFIKNCSQCATNKKIISTQLQQAGQIGDL